MGLFEFGKYFLNLWKVDMSVEKAPYFLTPFIWVLASDLFMRDPHENAFIESHFELEPEGKFVALRPKNFVRLDRYSVEKERGVYGRLHVYVERVYRCGLCRAEFVHIDFEDLEPHMRFLFKIRFPDKN